MRSIRRFIDWLGPTRAWTLFGLTAATGFLSLVMQAVWVETAASWAIPIQNVTLWTWLVGLVLVIGGCLAPESRRFVLLSVGPLLVSIMFGLFFREFFLWFLGAGVGWLFISQILARRNVRSEYQQAIRHLRCNEYDEAIKIITALIKTEPTESRHYDFRARLYRLKGKPERALKDYQTVIDLEPDSGVGYNGLSEVYLQAKEYEQALDYARMAYDREPDHWVAPYNLGMIEERLGYSEDVIEHLREALQLGTVDSRHRLLMYLWIARAYVRLGQVDDAEGELAQLRRQKQGLREWQTIFESEQAATLRQVLAEDIELARQIADGGGVEVFVVEEPLT